MKTFADLTDAEKSEIEGHYTSIRAILEGKAENLNMDERKSVPKIGRHRNSFVQKAMGIARKVSRIIPSSFEITLWNTNYNLFKRYKNLELSSKIVQEQFVETAMVVGSDVYTGALQFKGLLENANRSEPGLDKMVKELEKFFEQTPKDDEEEAEEIAEGDLLVE